MQSKILCTAAVLSLFSVNAYADGEIGVNEHSFIMAGTEHTTTSPSFIHKGEIYLHVDEVLPHCGLSLGWDDTLKAIVCENEAKNSVMLLTGKNTHIFGFKMYKYKNPMLYVGDICYINEELLEDITGLEVNALSDLGAKPGTVLGDDYRMSGEIMQHDPLYIINRDFAFEQVSIQESNTGYYAAIVNDFAKALPGVKVYNMLIPTPGEIYAPKEYYTGQCVAFENVFEQLQNVTPVRVAQELYKHADENIYFRRDHHWTQRGAYYAWKTFMEQKGETVPELNEFKKSETYTFSGSYLKLISNWDLLNETTEYAEKFFPIYDVTVKQYYDMHMQNYIADVKLVSPTINTYNCFISGDTPITVISGGNPNGRKLAIIKESFGNALATWAVNNYETVYVIDIRGFYDGSFNIKDFQQITGFDELLIESYPTTVESSDLRIGLLSLLGH